MHFSLIQKIHAHSDGIWTLTVEPRQRLLITGSLDEHVKIWKLDDCEVCSDLHAHKLGVLTVNAQSEHLISNSIDENIKIWDYSGNLIRSIKVGPLQSWGLATDGTSIVTGGHDGIINIYSLEDGSITKTIDTHGKFILSLRYSPDGRLIAASSESGVVYVIDAESFNIVHTLQAHTKPCRSLAFSPDSTHLITGGDDRRINIYELSQGGFISFFQTNSWPLSLTFFSSSIIASGHADSKVCVWDLDKKELMYTFNDHSDQVWAVTSMGDKLISGSDDGSFCVFQISS